MFNPDDLDPRYEWIDISTYSEPDTYMRGRCKHIQLTEVRLTLTNELVGRICATCDMMWEACEA